jgi:hypothetical protein
MGKHSQKTPEYQNTSFDSGLWGSSTNSKEGATYTPAGWMKNTMGTVSNNYNKTLQSMLNNDFTKDANFQAYQNKLNNDMTNYYNNNVLNDLARRGLVRSSALQSANTDFANTLTDRQLDLYDNYYNRLNNNLAALQGTSNQLYNYMTGVTGANQNLANAVNSHNLNKAQADNKDNSALWASLANTAGSAAGTIAGAAIASDINVKENIKKIGEKNGFNWYEFEYKDGYGLPKGKHEGVIAQEVEKVNPDAVIEENGIKKVNYAKLGLENEVE